MFVALNTAMSIEVALYDRLNDTSITALVGTNIYPDDPAETTGWPFLVYRCELQEQVVALTGLTVLAHYVVTVDVWAKSVAGRRAILEAVKVRMGGFQGGDIQLALLIGVQPEQLGSEEEGDIYHAAMTFSVWFSG